MIGYLGVDWSAKKVDCALVVHDGRAVNCGSAARTLPDVQRFVQALMKRYELDELHVVIEAGSTGWVDIFDRAGTTVHIADPAQAKAFAKSLCSSGAKDDRRDARNLALMGQSAPHRPDVWRRESDDVVVQRELAGQHEQLTRARGRVVQQLRAHLREHMPELERSLRNLSAFWVRRLLHLAPTAHDAVGLVANGYDAFRMAMHGSRARGSSLDAVWSSLETVAQSASESSTLAISRRLRVRSFLKQLELFEGQLREVEAQLDAMTADMDLRKTLESVGGIGMRMSMHLMALGFVGKPSHRDEVSMRMGASPVFQGSGETRSGKAKGRVFMRRATKSIARRTTYLLGRLASQQLTWASAMYADGRSRGQNAATVYRRIARSLFRILTAMVRNNEPYDERRYILALQANGVAWSLGLPAGDAT